MSYAFAAIEEVEIGLTDGIGDAGGGNFPPRKDDDDPDKDDTKHKWVYDVAVGAIYPYCIFDVDIAATDTLDPASHKSNYPSLHGVFGSGSGLGWYTKSKSASSNTQTRKCVVTSIVRTEKSCVFYVTSRGKRYKGTGSYNVGEWTPSIQQSTLTPGLAFNFSLDYSHKNGCVGRLKDFGVNYWWEISNDNGKTWQNYNGVTVVNASNGYGAFAARALLDANCEADKLALCCSYAGVMKYKVVDVNYAFNAYMNIPSTLHIYGVEKRFQLRYGKTTAPIPNVTVEFLVGGSQVDPADYFLDTVTWQDLSVVFAQNGNFAEFNHTIELKANAPVSVDGEEMTVKLTVPNGSTPIVKTQKIKMYKEFTGTLTSSDRYLLIHGEVTANVKITGTNGEDLPRFNVDLLEFDSSDNHLEVTDFYYDKGTQSDFDIKVRLRDTAVHNDTETLYLRKVGDVSNLDYEGWDIDDEVSLLTVHTKKNGGAEDTIGGWQFDYEGGSQGEWREPGSSFDILDRQECIVRFQTVEGYDTPNDIRVITEREDKVITGNYVSSSSVTPSPVLNIRTYPSVLADSKANWTIKKNGTTVKTGTGSDTIYNELEFGTYTIEFATFIDNGELYSVNGTGSSHTETVTFTEQDYDKGVDVTYSTNGSSATPTTGTLRVYLKDQGSPIEEVPNAKFSIDNSGTWLSSGSIISLSAGTHIISFSDVNGYIKPSSRSVTIGAGVTTINTYHYTPISSSAPATTGTVNIVSGGYSWRLFTAGMASEIDSGTDNKTKQLDPGDYVIGFTFIEEGAAVTYNFTVEAGQNKTIDYTGQYE